MMIKKKYCFRCYNELCMYYIHAYFSVTVTNGYAYNINMHFFFILAVFCKPYVCLFYNAE